MEDREIKSVTFGYYDDSETAKKNKHVNAIFHIDCLQGIAVPPQLCRVEH